MHIDHIPLNVQIHRIKLAHWISLEFKRTHTHTRKHNVSLVVIWLFFFLSFFYFSPFWQLSNCIRDPVKAPNNLTAWNTRCAYNFIKNEERMTHLFNNGHLLTINVFEAIRIAEKKVNIFLLVEGIELRHKILNTQHT